MMCLDFRFCTACRVIAVIKRIGITVDIMEGDVLLYPSHDLGLSSLDAAAFPLAATWRQASNASVSGIHLRRSATLHG
jgi:hypothetical protein